MIVESIRLQNIKSYGAGPDGSGVTVSFQPGVNRIAGANGCGKTTIVEALGYALFLASPIFEEKFAPETYLLAHGTKAGEIDVTFNAGGESYRLERGVGRQSKRRSKVVDEADGSICAEGDQEVAAFLSALLKLPSPDRLTELFSKLVGVKQGRLVLPFDSKPKDAKGFFEPLLEVEVFRQCYDRLKPVVDLFVGQRAERGMRDAVLVERIRERADAAERLDGARQEVEKQSGLLAAATRALEHAQEERLRQEGLDREVTEAAVAREQAAGALRLTVQGRQDAGQRVRESEEALRRAQASEPAYSAYVAADGAFRQLEESRKIRDVLRQERDAASKAVATLDARRDAAREHREQLLLQGGEKREACERAVADLASLEAELTSTEAAFERAQRAAESAGTHAAMVGAWAKGLPGLAVRMGQLATRITDVAAELSAWDPADLARAGDASRARATELEAARAAAAKTEERVATLRAQLDRLAGGVCPLLGEPCSQFDPDRAREDVSQMEAALVEDRRRVEAALAAHDEAEKFRSRLAAQENRLNEKRARLERDVGDYTGYVAEVLPAATSEALALLAAWAPAIAPVPAFGSTLKPGLSADGVAAAHASVNTFASEVVGWWPRAVERIGEDLEGAGLAKTERTRKETEARGMVATVKSLRQEVESLAQQAADRDLEAKHREADGEARRKEIASLDERLEPLAGLDEAIDRQLLAKEANKEGHDAWLQARPAAADLENRRTQLEKVKSREAELTGKLTVSDERLAKAKAAFDPATLAAAKADCEARSGEAAEARTKLEHAQADRDVQQQRFAEWQADTQESAAVRAEIARHTAAIQLTELARKTLRDSAPAVAQHLCARIATRAQAVYNQINPDPLELEWDAERYSLRITPGDRRFAMLSGGEQTKLALAMTLAMVEEFSRLRFCIFDEPTYGVDADSRRKLADAILQVQGAAGLDQLLLVSHDDAFEGQIEHTVLLRRSAMGGTSVEMQ